MIYGNDTRQTIIGQVAGQKEAKRFDINGIDLYLNDQTLVPHPDTFKMAMWANYFIKKHPKITTVADIGTGSGILALLLAKNNPKLTIYATDISAEAIEVAQKNMLIHGLNQRVVLLLNKSGKWLSEFDGKQLSKIDLVISNPPFVGDKKYYSKLFRAKYPEILHEPEKAIRSGDADGLKPFWEIMSKARELKVRYVIFQCAASNTDRLVKMLKRKFKIRVKSLSRGYHESRPIIAELTNSVVCRK